MLYEDTENVFQKLIVTFVDKLEREEENADKLYPINSNMNIKKRKKI